MNLFAALSGSRETERENEVTPTGNEVTPTQLRLRITWGGGTPKPWFGSIRFPDSRLDRPTILGIGTESAASIRISEQSIEIRQNDPSTFEGVDVDIAGHRDARILVSLATGKQLEPVTHEMTLGELISESRVFKLDEQHNRISMFRAPGDQIPFKTNREHLVFSPGDVFAFNFQARYVSEQKLTGDCRIEVFRARSNDAPLSSRLLKLQLNDHGSTTINEQQIDVPETEGVYDLRISFASSEQTPGGRDDQPPAGIERNIQFVVLANEARKKPPETLWETVYEVGPDGLRQSLPRQLNQITRLIGMQTESAVGTFQISDQSEASAVTLPLGGWQAIPLEISELNHLHLVEIDYDADQPMALGLSILQPDATGQVPVFGFDSGLHVPDSIIKLNETDSGTVQTHTFSFWPTSKRPFLLIANRSQTWSGSFRAVRIKKRDPDLDSDPGPSMLQPQEAARRRLMVFYEQPLIPENFAVADFVDRQLGQSINDWLTFYEGASRLIDHLQATGNGGAFISVYGEGSALMPLKSTQTTPRYDSGVFASDGRDPMRKDVLELLYRMFDRAGLVLVPVLSFDQRLAALEFADEEVGSDRELVDYRNMIRRPDGDVNWPVYNPLSLAVQQSVNGIIQEIADRYRGRNNWRGLSVVCRPDTYTLLPGSQMAGYDRLSLSRFVATLPDETSGPAEISTVLSDENFSRWLDWRVESMSQWYRQMDEIVSQREPDSKLYLTLIDPFRNEEVASMLSPSLHRPSDFSQAMHRLGLSSSIAQDPDTGIVLMKPHQLAPVHPLAAKKCERSIKGMRQLDNWFMDCGYAASNFSHRSSWARFETLEDCRFFSDQKAPIMRLQQLQPAGGWNRERFARALLTSDARLLVDGGLLLSTHRDKHLKRFIETYNSLPDVAFQTVPHATCPSELHCVAVRYLNEPEGTLLYAVNGSPWQVEVTLISDKAIGNTFQSRAKSPTSIIAPGENSQQLRITIAPFDLVAGRFSNPDARIESFRYQLPATAQRDLNKAYYRLRSKLLASASAPAVDLLENPGFENPELLNGWTIGGQTSDFLACDQALACEGQRSLRLDNPADRNVWIRSNPFPAPTTGRLSVSVWLKVADEDNQPPLRISLESSENGSGYYRFGEVGSLTSDGKRNQLTTSWKKFAVHFDDLPQHGGGPLRIGFDMMGQGSVWIDRVELFDRWLDENDVKALTQMLASIGPLIQQPEKMERCRQVLNGYWPTFLREYFPDETDKLSRSAETRLDSPARSTMRQRFRRFVSPGIFQFR